jgi:hypothetical protein
VTYTPKGERVEVKTFKNQKDIHSKLFMDDWKKHDYGYKPEF